MNPTRRPRRSALYMPGSHQRALKKARTLASDVVIFDLEDAVAPEEKPDARQAIRTALATGDYGGRELVIRANGIDTPWWRDDMDFIAGESAVSAVVLPKVESAQTLATVESYLSEKSAGARLELWPMLETPAGIAAVRAIASASERISCLVMGTQDLTKAMRTPTQKGRLGLLHVLSECVLAARLHGLDILDGVHADFRDDVGLKSVCLQGKGLGFDGKTLIHPSQITITNEIFGPDETEVARARAVVAAWAARPAGAGVIQLEGRMIESLHAEDARDLVAFAEAVEALERNIEATA